MPLLSCDINGRASILLRLVHVHIKGQQKLDYVLVAIVGGNAQWCGSIPISLVHVGAEGRKDTYSIRVAFLRSSIYGRSSILLVSLGYVSTEGRQECSGVL